MKLIAANRIYSQLGLWSTFGGFLGVALTFLPLWGLQSQLGLNLPAPVLMGIMLSGLAIGTIWAAIHAVGKSQSVLLQLKRRAKGMYGFELTDAELDELLPFKERFGWKSATQTYGTIARQVAGGTERRMLTRKGDTFFLDKVFLMELTEEIVEAELIG